MNAQRFDHAVVIGGGIAGLVTSRVLSEYFERVTLLERDAAPTAHAPRPGVPQGWHLHTLLPGGLLALGELFPGFAGDLEAAGSLQPGPNQLYFFRPEGKSYLLGTYTPEPLPDDGNRLVYVQTRALLEGCIRERVAALPNVQLRYDAAVEDVVAVETRVSGARLRSGEVVPADLVIDAMGRGGHTLQWLDRLGFERPATNTIRCDIAYTSVFLRPREPSLFEDVGFFIGAHPNGRAGGLVRMEHGTWLAMIAGRQGDYPPSHMPGFLEFAETLGQPYFCELLAQADVSSEPAAIRFKHNVRRRYELLARFPEGLLPIGDSICHFNPLYGQGMSAACRQASALGQILARRAGSGHGLRGLWRDFFPEAHRETRTPWIFAARSDFLDPRCEGDYPHEDWELIELLDSALTHAAKGDLESQRMLLAIQALVLPLEALRRPPWLTSGHMST